MRWSVAAFVGSLNARLLALVTTVSALTGTVCSCSQNEPAKGGTCASSASEHGIELERELVVLGWNRDDGTSGLGKIDQHGCLDEVVDLSLGADPVLRKAGRRVVLLERDLGLAEEIDPSSLKVTRSWATFRKGEPKSNPWDIDEDAQGRLWVARYDGHALGVIDKDGSLSSIDLASLADDDGSPEASAVRVVGATTLVAAQRLDRSLWSGTSAGAVRPGVVARIDTATGAINDVSELHGKNPWEQWVEVPGSDGKRFAIATPGNWDEIAKTDGIDVFDVETAHVATLIHETELNGSVSEFVLVSDTEAYASVVSPAADNPMWIVRFNPSTGTVDKVPGTDRSGFHWSGIAVTNEYLVLGDRTPHDAKILFYKRSDSSLRLVATLVPEELPPAALLALPE